MKSSFFLPLLLSAILLAGCDLSLPDGIALPPLADVSGTGASQVNATPHASVSGESSIRPYALQEAASLGLPSGLVLAVISQESGFDPAVVSSAGAEGLMQLMPGTIEDINRAGAVQVLDPFDPAQNIAGGCWYLKTIKGELPSGQVLPADSWKFALASYNAGPGAVRRAITQALTGAPLHPQAHWEDVAPGLPGETQRYVPAVMAQWQRYGNS